MKDLGIIAWALFLSYLFFNDYFWWIWGGAIGIGLAAGIYKAIKSRTERGKKKKNGFVKERL